MLKRWPRPGPKLSTRYRLLPWVYVVALVGVWATFRWLGEFNWFAAFLLFVPRLIWALPLVWFGIWAARTRSVAVGAPSAIAFVLWVSLLSGFRWSSRGETIAGASPGGRHLRVFVQNAHGIPEAEALVERLRVLDPDFIVMQEAGRYSVPWWTNAMASHEWHRRGEHLFGSRFPVGNIVEVWAKGYVRYDVEVGPRRMTVFSIHPPSPQFAFRHVFRGHDPRYPKEWTTLPPLAVLRSDVEQRRRVLEAIAADAGLVRGPVIIAGDSNTPDGGRTLRDHFSRWTDAFQAVGRGFGHTFPAGAPWLRLDRVWVSQELQVVGVQQDNTVNSDHRALVVELQPDWSW